MAVLNPSRSCRVHKESEDGEELEVVDHDDNKPLAIL